MLEDSLFESQGHVKTRKPLTVALAVLAHAVTITALVLTPLLKTQALTLPAVKVPLPALRTPSKVLYVYFPRIPPFRSTRLLRRMRSRHPSRFRQTL
jgi:hypothetical protein